MTEDAGAYTAERAAALSGVPKSTVYYWARTQVLEPSVSPVKVQLWSYADLLGLRFVYWLRRKKVTTHGDEIPATSMPTVRRALTQLRSLDLALFDEEGHLGLLVSLNGRVHVNPPDEAPRDLQGQLISEDLLDLIAPFQTVEGCQGPDLVSPGRFVRIVPRKLSGAPHILKTRIETQALHALEARGFSAERIATLYPTVERPAIDDALRVEKALAENLHRAA